MPSQEADGVSSSIRDKKSRVLGLLFKVCRKKLVMLTLQNSNALLYVLRTVFKSGKPQTFILIVLMMLETQEKLQNVFFREVSNGLMPSPRSPRLPPL